MSDDRWKAWGVGALVVLGIGGWMWWQNESPAPLDGVYECEGRTVQTDGTRSLINASAEVVKGKIRPGETGADIAFGHQVVSWGKVKNSSRTEFLVELRPTNELAQALDGPFWITCQHNRYRSP